MQEEAEGREPATEHINIRVTPSQKRAISSRASMAGRSVSRFLVERALDDRVSVPPELADAVRKTRRELVRQGTNLNQLAHAANRLAMKGDAGALACGELSRQATELAPSLRRAMDAASDAMARVAHA